MLNEYAKRINLLGEFCGMRDVRALTPPALREKYGFDRADVMVLFGGSILCGGDVLAQSMQAGAAKTYVIVGGAGHTTQTLREKMHRAFPAIDATGQPEAQIFARYLQLRYGLEADYLECESTNCGNNITFMLNLLQKNGVDCSSIILAQDATMQRRMDAGMRKYADAGLRIINYATYAAKVVVKNGALEFENPAWGMWDMNRYVELLMGEIPRLSDDANGYGPRGRNFISHVDIPLEVRAAFEELQNMQGVRIRAANEMYATRK